MNTAATAPLAIVEQPARTTGLALAEMKQIAIMLANSGYFSKIAKPEQAFAKILYGAEIGIGPMAAIAGVHIVEGKPTLDASLVRARIKQSGRYDYKIRRNDDTGAKIEFFERGDSLGCAEFTEKDAAKAGLLGKDNWKKYPRAMYLARATTEGARTYTPDVFNGAVYTPDELGDMPAMEVVTPAPDQLGVARPMTFESEPTGAASPPSAEVIPDETADGATLRAWIGRRLAIARKSWTGDDMKLVCGEVATVLGLAADAVTPRNLNEHLLPYRNAIASKAPIAPEPDPKPDQSEQNRGRTIDDVIGDMLAAQGVGDENDALQEKVAELSAGTETGVIYAWRRLPAELKALLLDWLQSDVPEGGE